MMKVAIIGAGTAGLASAILLSNLDYQCDIYDEIPEPKAIGAGILLQPQGLNVLDEIGVFPEILNTGSVIHNLFGQTTNDKVVMDFNYSELHEKLYGLGIHRGHLFQILYDKAVKSINQIYTSHRVTKIENLADKTHLTCENGLVKDYDFIVVANGTWSNLYHNLNIKVKHTPYAWGALWKIFNNQHNFSQTTLNQKYNQAHTMAGMLPTGTCPINNQSCISFFWSLKTDQYQRWRQDPIDDWKIKVTELWPDIAPFIEQINHHDELKFVNYADTVMNKWHDKRIVILGDAAHAMSPQLGQGANMALVDALQLLDSIQSNPSIEEALSHYSKKRKKHIKFYQHASRLLTPFFQSNSQIAATLRDFIFPPMKYIPIAKKHALTTLFGVKSSLLSNKPTINLNQLANNLSNRKQ